MQANVKKFSFHPKYQISTGCLNWPCEFQDTENELLNEAQKLFGAQADKEEECGNALDSQLGLINHNNHNNIQTHSRGRLIRMLGWKWKWEHRHWRGVIIHQWSQASRCCVIGSFKILMG